MGKIFDLVKTLGPVIIFIDEIDAVASSRDDAHEASKRILSVLLRKIDGFDTTKDQTMLICATNRKKDLDEAFLSRIDSSVLFPLPDATTRKLIFKQYARHLADEDVERLGEISSGLSGRNIKDVCQDTERKWVSKIIRKGSTGDLPTDPQGSILLPTDPQGSILLPPLNLYTESTLLKVKQQI
eukprot:GHVL01001818.1.p1 GENE.GHVL01001818.1~~GHVL01001818.1.p1  ORF type:complete len:184 (-),score=45.67 GHVL01001818.1:633-1184(-)